MTGPEVLAAIVAAIEGLTPDKTSKEDGFTYFAGDPAEANKRDRIFVLVLREGPDRITTRGHCHEERVAFDLQVQYNLTDDAWDRMLLDGRLLMDAIVGLRTVSGIKVVQEDDPTEYLYSLREVVAIRSFRVTYGDV